MDALHSCTLKDLVEYSTIECILEGVNVHCFRIQMNIIAIH